MDTIAAISTGNVLSGIGIIRISGPDTLRVLERVFTPTRGAPMAERQDRLLVYGALRGADGGTLDLCLATISRGPHSYTGEDTAELQCHGSPTVLRAGLEALFAAGARQAGPGEFTKRAFLNGRMDLTQAEAVIDLIHAETDEAAKNAAGQLGGALRRRTDGVYDALCDILSHFQAAVDYPEEGVEPFELADYADTLRAQQRTLRALLETAERGSVLTGGVPAVILGRPNAGKSSLLNALLGYDRAIVTDIPGTTRDTITEKLRLGGVLLRLTDTAGLRETTDAVERVGVERARAAVREAELALVLIDGAAAGEENLDILRSAQDVKRILVIYTKADLAPAPTAPDFGGLRADGVLSISARTGEGLDALRDAVARLYPAPDVPAGELLTNARQTDAVRRAADALAAAEQALSDGVAPDAALTGLEEAMDALGELSGRTVREDITNRIFERFCVGK